jgi:hypothetical protein
MATGNRTLKLSILADVDDLKKKLNEANGDVEVAATGMEKFGKKAAAAFKLAAVAAAGMAVKIGIDAVKAASDLSEEIQKSQVIFGEGASEIEAFASKAAKAFGQTKQQAIQASSSFAVFGKAAGLAGGDLVKFSTDFTGLASDLASFNNTSPEDAIQAIGAALRGEAEPLRRYGVLLNDATLKQAALELGIYDGNGALTAQQKVLAAQKVIYEQTTDAQGDFARTSDGLANKQRILTAEFENIKAKIGEVLLPMVLKLVTFITDSVLPNLQKFADYFKPITSAIMDNKEVFKAFADFITTYVVPVLAFGLSNALKSVGVIAGGVIEIIGGVIRAVESAVSGAISAINSVIRAYNAIPILPNIPTIGASASVASAATTTTTASTATKTATTAQQASAAARAGTTVNNITVKAVDSEGAARAVAKVLTKSSARSIPALDGASIRAIARRE